MEVPKPTTVGGGPTFFRFKKRFRPRTRPNECALGSMAHGASSEYHSVSLRPIFFSLDSFKLKKVAKIDDFDAPEGVKISKKYQNFHENDQLLTFRLLKTDCDAFALSFDVRCTVESLAHRLTCIAAFCGK